MLVTRQENSSKIGARAKFYHKRVHKQAKRGRQCEKKRKKGTSGAEGAGGKYCLGAFY